MAPAEPLLELDIRRDDEAPPRVARVGPRALLDIVRTALSLNGAIWIRVTGNSMNPLIRHGDRVLVVAPQTPSVGSVILLDAQGMPLLHRIIVRRAETLVTRGDSRRTSDEQRTLADVVGHAVLVRRGSTAVCLAPTLAFGIAPLLRALAWWVRVRIPDSWIAWRRGRGGAWRGSR